jgi:hypothetical protein
MRNKRKNKMRKATIVGITTALLTAGSAAFAQTSVSSNGSIPGATFGGTGEPNSAVQITTITDGSDVITLGLQAQQRGINNPAPTVSGSTYTVGQGIVWNFDWYANVKSTTAGPFSGYSFKLPYGFDPSGATPNGVIQIDQFNDGSGLKQFNPPTAQNSENLSFSFLAGNLFSPVVIAPTSGPSSYDPNATGDYVFVEEAFDARGSLIGTDRIDVNVVPDVTSSAMLLGLTLGGMAIFARSRKGQANLA